MPGLQHIGIIQKDQLLLGVIGKSCKRRPGADPGMPGKALKGRHTVAPARDVGRLDDQDGIGIEPLKDPRHARQADRPA